MRLAHLSLRALRASRRGKVWDAAEAGVHYMMSCYGKWFAQVKVAAGMKLFLMEVLPHFAAGIVHTPDAAQLQLIRHTRRPARNLLSLAALARCQQGPVWKTDLKVVGASKTSYSKSDCHCCSATGSSIAPLLRFHFISVPYLLNNCSTPFIGSVVAFFVWVESRNSLRIFRT